MYGQGIVPSIGHTNASEQVGQTALTHMGQNPRRATHYSNAMPKSTLPSAADKTPSVANAILEDSNTAIELIVDGIHVKPDDVKYFVTTAGQDRVILITDGISARGLGDGLHYLGSTLITVKDNVARVYTPPSGKFEDVDMAEFNKAPLAGSLVFMHQAVKNMIDFAGVTLGQALQMATENPARNLGFSNIGTIQPGKLADFVILDGQSLQPVATLMNGKFVSQEANPALKFEQRNVQSAIQSQWAPRPGQPLYFAGGQAAVAAAIAEAEKTTRKAEQASTPPADRPTSTATV